MTLHVFNPAHDEALASFSPYYYPSKAARRLASGLAMLPSLWAAAGDAILLLPENGSTKGARVFVVGADSAPRPLRRADVEGLADVMPWGWNPLLVRQLRELGVPCHLLPGDEALAEIRRFSSRATAVALLERVRRELPQGTTGQSCLCQSEEEVRRAVAAYGRAMLKLPWSCSGRGVFGAAEGYDEACAARIRQAIRTQGAIEVEPFYQRVCDFAMEFRANADDGSPRVSYEGVSLFLTSSAGGYEGNVVAPQEVLRQMLLRHVSLETLQAVRHTVAGILADMLPACYRGPFGVDMMLVRPAKNAAWPAGSAPHDAGCLLHPCIEINLRQTMGHVALHLSRRVAGTHRFCIGPVQGVEPQHCLFVSADGEWGAVLHDFVSGQVGKTVWAGKKNCLGR